MKLKKIPYTTSSGHDCFQLMHRDIGFIEEYSRYLEHLIKLGLARNTIVNYAQDLKVFFEYIFCFNDLEQFSTSTIQTTLLHDIIIQFPDYLLAGKAATGVFSKFAVEANKKNHVSNAAAARILSTVNQFLKQSAEQNIEFNILKSDGLINIDIEPDTMFSEILSKKLKTSVERAEILSNSMLANVIRNGFRYSQSSVFSVGKRQGLAGLKDGDKVEKAFPVRELDNLLSKATTYLDTCLWAVLAGTGCRPEEAIQILLTDVDIDNETIYLIDPQTRTPVYAGVDEKYRKKLNWKARNISTVFFLEPYKSLFFNNLQSYLLLERRKCNPNHNFLFVSMSNANRGDPLIGSNSMNTKFKNAQKDLGLSSIYPLYSLRHFYGVWTLNYIKIGENSYGLPLDMVCKIMGHQSEKSTKQYAVVDKIILSAIINAANALVSSPNNTLEVAQEALEYKIKMIREKTLG